MEFSEAIEFERKERKQLGQLTNPEVERREMIDGLMADWIRREALRKNDPLEETASENRHWLHAFLESERGKDTLALYPEHPEAAFEALDKELH